MFSFFLENAHYFHFITLPVFQCLGADYIDGDTPRGFPCHTNPIQFDSSFDDPNSPSTINRWSTSYPTPHQVSIAVFKITKKRVQNTRGLSTLFMTFGQFLDHDMTLTPHEECKKERYFKDLLNDLVIYYPSFFFHMKKHRAYTNFKILWGISFIFLCNWFWMLFSMNYAVIMYASLFEQINFSLLLWQTELPQCNKTLTIKTFNFSCSNIQENFRYPCFPLKFDHNKARCTGFARSNPVCQESFSYIHQPRNQVNMITSYIDASTVYGSDGALALKLRARDGKSYLLLIYSIDLRFKLSIIWALLESFSSIYVLTSVLRSAIHFVYSLNQCLSDI